MADPTIQTFCCHHSGGEADTAVKIMSEFNTYSYNNVCLLSSGIGILGAIYQILPRVEKAQRCHRLSTIRGRKIIIWLAIADLLASSGVLIRSALWLKYKNIMPVQGDDAGVLFCAVTSAWTQYFYTATWLWTLFYAVDTWQALRGTDTHMTLYHMLAWGLPVVTTSAGLSVLYIPDATCHNLTSLRSALMRVLPNYCVTYVPIAVVMIANPIIYVLAGKDVEIAVSLPLAQFTSKERKLVDAIKLKFFLINASFYVCWLPNLINGVLIWTMWIHIPHDVIVSVWYIMALTNPMQALLNSLVYRRWSSGAERIVMPEVLRTFNWKSKQMSSERTPLVGSEPPPRLQLQPMSPRSINNYSTIR